MYHAMGKEKYVKLLVRKRKEVGADVRFVGTRQAQDAVRLWVLQNTVAPSRSIKGG
jgi:hypothetical protein